MKRRSIWLAAASLGTGTALAALLYCYDDTFPWLLYGGVGLAGAIGAYGNLLDLADRRTAGNQG